MERLRVDCTGEFVADGPPNSKSSSQFSSENPREIQ